MPYGEAVRLAQVLMRDPSSAICSAVNEWESPRTREWLLLADLFDLTHKAHAGKRANSVKPYPRPFGGPKRRGRTTRTRDEVLAILAAHGHNIGGGHG